MVGEEGQDLDTLQSSVSFCGTNSPKQIPMTRKLATATQVFSRREAALEPGPGLRRPDIHLGSGPHQAHMNPMATRRQGSWLLIVPDVVCLLGSEANGVLL